MTIIRKYNADLPDYLDRFFGRDSFDNYYPYRNDKPAVNIQETNDEFVLEVAAPGYSKKDFSVNVDNDELKVSAKKDGAQENGYALKEFNLGEFERVFDLPETVESDKIHASYENGILRVIIPKREEAKVKPPRLIEIK